jgi:Methyltransferase domain
VSRILDRVGPADLVLDVGAWGRPFARADWVIDLMPYESRGLYGRDGEGAERFGPDTWVVRDICEREAWPFEDGRFDFAICSHVLEDVRDPVWVCSELERVARSGYIEAPSRLEEQSYGFQGPWVGWGHHHWLVEVEEDRIEFTFKHHVIHGLATHHFPDWFHATLSDEEKVERLWWQGTFSYREQVMTSAEELDPYLARFVEHHLGVRKRPGRRRRR